MEYIELTVHTTSEASELVADVMWQYTEGGVAVSDAKDVVALLKGETGVYWDYIDEELQAPRADVLVKCFLRPEAADAAISSIRAQLLEMQARGGMNFGSLEETRRTIDGDDWIDVWKKHFRPIHVGARVVVVPAWIGYTKEADEVVVTLDSNMAFGTGEHETTKMCLEALQEVVREGDVVIDVGCGSGILGIAAAELGAKTCYLTDIDPVAVESAKHNALKNGVLQKCIVAHSDLLEQSDVRGDVVLANITAEILVRLAPSIPKNLKEGGTLILSGVIADRLPLVKAAFAAQGLTLLAVRNMGEWYALVYRR